LDDSKSSKSRKKKKKKKKRKQKEEKRDGPSVTQNYELMKGKELSMI